MKINAMAPCSGNDFGDSCRESTGTRLTLISY